MERTAPAALAPSAADGSAERGPTLLRPLRVRDFRLIFAGETISVLGDQFHFVALAWLSFSFQALLYGASWVRVAELRAAASQAAAA